MFRSGDAKQSSHRSMRIGFLRILNFMIIRFKFNIKRLYMQEIK